MGTSVILQYYCGDGDALNVEHCGVCGDGDRPQVVLRERFCYLR